MQDRQQRLQQRLEPESQAFRDQCRTLVLATRDPEGAPNVSYAPFALGDGGYYVLISDIARHARNLKLVPRVSLMLIEDQSLKHSEITCPAVIIRFPQPRSLKCWVVPCKLQLAMEWDLLVN